NNNAQVDKLQVELKQRQQQLVKLLQIKADHLQSLLQSADEAQRPDLQTSSAVVQRALAEVAKPDASIDADPDWLRVLPNSPATVWLALLMGVGCGMLCGLLNGLLIVVLRVVPFIATLGTMTIYLGLAKLVADETAVRPGTAQVPAWLGELSAVRPDPAWL